MLHLATPREKKAECRLFSRQRLMFFALFRAKMTVFDRQIKLDGGVALYAYAFCYTPFELAGLLHCCIYAIATAPFVYFMKSYYNYSLSLRGIYSLGFAMHLYAGRIIFLAV